MNEFFAYLQLGFLHITDLAGYDHILFVVALCAIYELKDWKKIALLVTAFTIGHSVTLALSTLNIIHFNKNIVEMLIPLSIIITCFLNFKTSFKSTGYSKNNFSLLRYPMAVAFGLIHGMGFSSYLKSMLGKDQSIFKQLLAFNIGLEIGQLIIVFITLTLSLIALDILKIKRITWVQFISGFTAGMAFHLIIERI